MTKELEKEVLLAMECRPNCRRVTNKVNVGFCMNCKDLK